MADPDTTDDSTLEDQGGKSSKLGLILALVLLLAGAGAGYFGISMGLIPLGGSSHAAAAPAKKAPDMPDVAFVEIPTMIITLPPDANHAHLKFSAKIEVPAEYQGDVEYLMPRIQDILNGYLRALTARDIEGPGSLLKLRAQMFRRIVLVVGLGRANNLLVTEFVLN